MLVRLNGVIKAYFQNCSIKHNLKVSSARALKGGTQLKSSVVCQLWGVTRNKMRVMWVSSLRRPPPFAHQRDHVDGLPFAEWAPTAPGVWLRLHFKINLKFIVAAIALNDVAARRVGWRVEKVVYTEYTMALSDLRVSKESAGRVLPSFAAHSIYVNAQPVRPVQRNAVFALNPQMFAS